MSNRLLPGQPARALLTLLQELSSDRAIGALVSEELDWLKPAVRDLPAWPGPPVERPETLFALDFDEDEGIRQSDAFLSADRHYKAYQEKSRIYEDAAQRLQPDVLACCDSIDAGLRAAIHAETVMLHPLSDGAGRLARLLRARQTLLAIAGKPTTQRPPSTTWERTLDVLARLRRECPDLPGLRTAVSLMRQLDAMKRQPSGSFQSGEAEYAEPAELTESDRDDPLLDGLRGLHRRLQQTDEKRARKLVRAEAASLVLGEFRLRLHAELRARLEPVLTTHGDQPSVVFDADAVHPLVLLLDLLCDVERLYPKASGQVSKLVTPAWERARDEAEDTDWEDALDQNLAHFADGQYGSGGAW